jgi:signal transduction histidine kinase
VKAELLSSLLPVSRGQRALTLTLVALAAAAVMAVSESAFRMATEASESLLSRQTVRFEMATLLRYMNAAESAQRGFLILGRDDYLRPLTERRQDINNLLAKVSHNYQAGVWSQQVADLSRSVDEKFAELDETIRLYRIGSHDAWRALMEADIGRERMDAVRNASDKLIAFEGERIASSREAINRALLLGRFGVHVLTLLSLVGLLVFLRKNAALVETQRRHALELKLERDRLDGQVMLRTSQLTELARHLQTVREDERAHLARELHDELGALLTTAKLDLARLRRALKASPQPELLERLQHLGAALDQGIELKRRIIEDLRPSALSNLGLAPALEILLREFGERSGLRVEVELDEDFKVCEDRGLALYRFVQEALTNVAKYAKASQVTVRLRASSEEGCLALVQDDGIGFDAEAQTVGRHGLVGMRYRIESLGGRLDIDSAPGRGTRLTVDLPPLHQAAV